MVSSIKANVFWLIGTLAIFLGARTAGQVDRAAIGVSTTNYYIALGAAFFLIMIGGLMWISVAGAIRDEL